MQKPQKRSNKSRSDLGYNNYILNLNEKNMAAYLLKDDQIQIRISKEKKRKIKALAALKKTKMTEMIIDFIDAELMRPGNKRKIAEYLKEQENKKKIL